MPSPTRICPPMRTGAIREHDRTRRFVAYHFDDPLAPVLLGRAALDPELAELEAVSSAHDAVEFAAENIRHGQELGQLPADTRRRECRRIHHRRIAARDRPTAAHHPTANPRRGH